MRASARRVSAADQRGADNAHGESDRQADHRVVLDLARDRANGALALAAQFFRHIANALLHALRPVCADLRQIAHGPRCLVDPRTELLDGFGRLSGAQGDPVAAAIRSKDRLTLGFMLLSHIVYPSCNVEPPTQTPGGRNRSHFKVCGPDIVAATGLGGPDEKQCQSVSRPWGAAVHQLL